MSDRIQTHSDECWRWHGHSACAERKVEELTAEIERLSTKMCGDLKACESNQESIDAKDAKIKRLQKYKSLVYSIIDRATDVVDCDPAEKILKDFVARWEMIEAAEMKPLTEQELMDALDRSKEQ